jgi:DNA replication protein DnaC
MSVNSDSKNVEKNNTEQRIIALATTLRLYSFSNFRQVCDLVRPFDENLLTLMEHEHLMRSQMRVSNKIKRSGLPVIKRFEDFEMETKYLPKVDFNALRATASCEFIPNRRNIIFMGPSGRGKTHMAIAIGIEAIKQKYTVVFKTADQIATEMTEAKSSKKLTDYLRILLKADLLILDELGYCCYSPEESTMLFRVISERNEKLSTIITTNHKFAKWGQFICGAELTAAMIDRLCSRAEIFNMSGPRGYRIRNFNVDNDGDDDASSD